MGAIVPQKFRDYFFGTRSFFGQIGKILGFIIAFFVLKLNYSVLILLAVLRGLGMMWERKSLENSKY